MPIKATHTRSDERRTQRRLPTRIPVDVALTSNHHGSFHAVSHNLSWGGAQLITSTALDAHCPGLRLIFPWRQASLFEAEAEVVRHEVLDSGRIEIAARFSRLSPLCQRRLERLLQRLPTPIAQINLPLAEQLDILFNDPADILETLDQIRAGRLLVTTFSGYRLDQSIRLRIANTRHLPPLVLRSRVLGQEPLLLKGHEWANLTQLDLRFEHSARDLQRGVELFLRLAARTEPQWMRERDEPPSGWGASKTRALH
ncbi:MAG: PilZ domain-containing protein [Chromatiaceae bacterium]|nr:PilZ domain-containing protein [Chromatiaceae bacterium]